MPKKVILGKNPEADILLEISGTDDDGVKIFNHHSSVDKAKGLISPGCRNIEKFPDKSIGIDHFDTDVYLFIRRAWGLKMPDLDYGLLDILDSKGTAFCPNYQNETLEFFFGVQKLSSIYGIISCGSKSRDITRTVKDIMKYPVEVIIGLGKLFVFQSETTYHHKKECYSINNKIGLWVTDKDHPMDSNRPFKDSFQVIVIYDKTNQKISLRVSHDNTIELAGQTLAGIKFAGHPKACGSPKGLQYSLKDAMEVYCDLCNKYQNII